jgi:phosphomevalonate kinase
MALGSASLAKLERYLPLNPGKIAKTGLGSSAALVSALSSSLFSWGLNIATFENLKPHLDLVHNLAQLAHCHAQGKIGSGFDISSAFFGSQLYRRFDAASLAAIMETAAHLSPSQLREKLAAIKVGFGGSVALPPGLKLVLGESGKDMHTPTSVKKVLDWLAASQETGRKHFEDLDSANRKIIDLLLELHRLHGVDQAQYDAARHEVCTWSSTANWTETAPSSDSTKMSCLSIFRALRQTFQEIRRLLKLMGDVAGTAIEPDEVTHVLDGTLQKVPGAVFAGAPGAGGYDAIFAVLVDDSQGQRGQLESFWLANEELPICPLLTEEDGHGIRLQKVL